MLFEVRSLLEVLGYAYQLPGQPCLVTSGLLLLDSHYVTRAIAIASSYKNLQGETIFNLGYGFEKLLLFNYLFIINNFINVP